MLLIGDLQNQQRWLRALQDLRASLVQWMALTISAMQRRATELELDLQAVPRILWGLLTLSK
jgi:hypothetical protein